MYNHAPKDYICPFCLIAKGVENENLHTTQSEIVYKDDYITAFIASGWWKNNKGHIIIIPNKHFENIYDLSDQVSAKIHKLEKQISIGMKKVYKCDGVSSRQHNEPCGNQDVWHYHLHVFPRYKDDNLYLSERGQSDLNERLEYAKLLRDYFIEKKYNNEL